MEVLEWDHSSNPRWKIMNNLVIALAVLTISFCQNATAKKLAELEKLYQLDTGFVGIIHDQQDSKIYLKIDNLGSEFIYQTSLPAGLGSNDIGLDRGQLSETRLVVFERIGNRVFLKQLPTDYRAITDNVTEATAVDEAFASSILWAFVIEDSGDNWVLVDAGEFVLQDIHGVARHLAEQKQGIGFAVDTARSAIDISRTKSFPDNTELQSTVTLAGEEAGDFLRDTSPDPYAVTLKMHHSFVRLPADGFQPRKFYPKSGYWTVQYKDYAQPINQQINQRMIGRHRLNKLNPQAASGAAVTPIVYYLDPGVPEPVRTALIDGALWWNSAFEAIGFEDAFQVKILPADADPMDVRYNVIQWVHRSTRGWSYGSSVADPRTGEIIKGHVTLGSLRVRQDYLIAQGMMAPFSTNEEDSNLMDLALARIRQLSAHEVGHTLGLNHNFAASNYGRESVMDYPHPQFELDGDRVIAPEAYGVGLGKWDKAAIAYGYQQFPEGENNTILKQMLAENDKNGLLYISDADARSTGSAHAGASLWDNGADAVIELEKMLKIRQTAISNFGSSNLKIDKPWSDLEEIFVPVYYFHRYQVEAAGKWLGGLLYDYSIKKTTRGQRDKPAQTLAVSGAQQMLALKTLLKTLSPEFLKLAPETVAMMVPKASGNTRTRESINGETGVSFDTLALASASAQHTLSTILHPQRLARIVQQNAIDESIPSIHTITDELHQSIIVKESNGIEASIHQSVVDLIYSNYLNLLHDTQVSRQVKMQILGVLLLEKDYLVRKLGKVNKKSSYFGFYAYQSKRLDDIAIAQTDQLIELPRMPPGSPI